MDDKSFNIRVPKRWVRVGMVAVVTALIVAPLSAIAAHTFTDVPDTNTFHEDIAWLKDAGVTLGCNPPANTLFCPKDEVTREQMSAFMRRLAENQVVDAATALEAENADALDGIDSTGFVQQGEANSITAAMVSDEAGASQQVAGGSQGTYTAAYSSEASASIDAPTDGYVLAIASAEYYVTHVNGNTSTVDTGVSDSGTSLNSSHDHIWTIPASAPSGQYATTMSHQRIFPVTAGSHTFHLVARSADSGNLADATVSLVFLSTAYGTVDQTSESGSGSDTE